MPRLNLRQLVRHAAAVFAVAALVGCGSSVKLDDVPVEDKTARPVVTAPAPVTPASTGASGGQAAQSGVASVDLNRPAAAAPGPAGVGRIVYFDYDSFVVRAEDRPIIEAHARFLAADRNRRVALEGHTDERGGREYNLALGQKRAEAVRRALVLLGAQESQLEAVSFGEEKPAEAGATEAAYAKNRRTELSYR
jgi:peptidoglycan-associated lipoprotein